MRLLDGDMHRLKQKHEGDEETAEREEALLLQEIWEL
jgi:hypothetical protein